MSKAKGKGEGVIRLKSSAFDLEKKGGKGQRRGDIDVSEEKVRNRERTGEPDREKEREDRE